MADERWYGRFYIGHLHVSERQRIRDGNFNPQEKEMLARGEDPWEHLRKPLPPDLKPPDAREHKPEEPSTGKPTFSEPQSIDQPKSGIQALKDEVDRAGKVMAQAAELLQRKASESPEERALRKREELLKREEELQRRRESEARQRELRAMSKRLGFTPMDEITKPLHPTSKVTQSATPVGDDTRSTVRITPHYPPPPTEPSPTAIPERPIISTPRANGFWRGLSKKEIAALIAGVATVLGLVCGFITSALQIAGIIDMAIAHLLIFLSWIVVVAGAAAFLFLWDRLSTISVLLRLTILTVTALVTGAGLLLMDSWMVNKRAELLRKTPSDNERQPPLSPTSKSSPSPAVSPVGTPSPLATTSSIAPSFDRVLVIKPLRAIRLDALMAAAGYNGSPVLQTLYIHNKDKSDRIVCWETERALMKRRASVSIQIAVLSFRAARSGCLY